MALVDVIGQDDIIDIDVSVITISQELRKQVEDLLQTYEVRVELTLENNKIMACLLLRVRTPEERLAMRSAAAVGH